MSINRIPFPDIVHRYSLKEETDNGYCRPVPRKPTKIVPRSCVGCEFPLEARPIIFPNTVLRNVPLSPLYREGTGLSYVQQCFENINFIGEGSYGIVFQGRSKDDGKYYAIKKFKDRFRSTAHRNVRLNEVYRYGSIPQSQYCVELVRAWEESGHLFIQMELCSITLDQYVRQHKVLEEETLWNILLDLLLGIKHLHSHEFIHLDIKPDNILVSSNNVFKLGDFGLMLDLSKGPIKDAEEGDSRYLAPEVLNGKFTKAADIFSIGISMLEVASNIRLPSSGPLWHELRCGILPWEHFTCSSQEFYELLRVMMLPSYKDRPTVEKILKHHKLCKLQRNRYIQAIFYEMAATMKSWYNYGKSAAVHYGLGVLKPFHNLCKEVTWKEPSVLTFQSRVINSRAFDRTIIQSRDSTTSNSSTRSQSSNGSCNTPISCKCSTHQHSLQVTCKKRILLDDASPFEHDSESRNKVSPKRRKLFD